MSSTARADAGAGGLESGRIAQPQRFPGLDAFRGIGMVMVMLIHVHASTNDVPRGVVGHILQRMDVGLEIFFVLSGFLIFRPFVQAYLGTGPPVRRGSYLRRRVLRIFPGYWFALIMALILFSDVTHIDGIKSAVAYFGLLQSFVSDPEILHGGIEQSWTLMTELSFYVMLPLFAAAMTRLARGRSAITRTRLLFAGVALLYLGGVLFRIALIAVDDAQGAGHNLGYRMTLWLPGHLDFFAIGMAFSIVSVQVARGARCPSVIDWLARHPAWSWTIATGIFLGYCTTSPGESLFNLGPEYSVRLFLYGIIASLLLTPSFFGDQSQGRIRSFLASRVMVYLGTVSLGFYLWHLHILDELRIRMDLAPFAGTSSDFVVLVFATFALAMVAATVSYFGVERPFLMLKDRPISSLWKRPAAGADAGRR